MLTPIVFWGAKGHAKVLREFAGRCGYELVAVFDNDPHIAPPFGDVPLYYGRAGFAAWRQAHPDLRAACAVAIGGARGRDRVALLELLAGDGLTPATLLHPSAVIAADARIAPGAQVLAGAVLSVEVTLGKASIINTSASVDHESVLGEGVHVAPGATLAGRVTVGDY